MPEIDSTIEELQAHIAATSRRHRGLTGLLHMSQGEARTALQAVADGYVERIARLQGMLHSARLLKEHGYPGDVPVDLSAEAYANLQGDRQAIHEAFEVFRPAGPGAAARAGGQER